MNQAVEVPATRTALQNLPWLAGRWPQLIVRLGYAHPAPRSDRRPLEEVFFH
jgi:hypothetical protein